MHKWLTAPALLVLMAASARADGPSFPIQAPDSPPAPTSLTLIVCRADDLTGQPGRHGVDPITGEYDPSLAAKDWKDFELHVEDGELECKRVVADLTDAAVAFDDSGRLAKPLDSDFGDAGECVHAAAMYGPQFEQSNKGWVLVAAGCPAPITDPTGKIIGWRMPECPRYLSIVGNITCKFDESFI
jgi:hypothetical protein